MALSQGLVQKLGTSLTMTPQLQQAIRLLQLSTIELEQEIEKALEENPLLELDDGSPQPELQEDLADPLAAKSSGESSGGVESNSEVVNTTAQESLQPSVETDVVSAMESSELPEESESPLDTTWEERWDEGLTSARRVSSSLMDDDGGEYQAGTQETLKDHLLWQLNLSPFSPTDNAIARAVIDAVNDLGYLTESIPDLIDATQNIILEDRIENEDLDPAQINIEEELAQQEEILPEEVISVIHRVQLFEPVGVATSDLKECLSVQLKHLHHDDPNYEKALELVSNYLDLLGAKDYRTLMRRLSVKDDNLKQILDLIKSTDPNPGLRYYHDESQYVKPDVLVHKVRGEWRVELNPECSPRLRVNNSYASIIASSSDSNSSDKQYVKAHLNEAKWFIRSLETRNDTLLKVAACIVSYQKDFLEYGPEKMKPLILSDIALEVDMHESTVSRVTTQKYMYTPQGMFELKYFFSSSVHTDAGGECSSTAVQAMIKKIVDSENKRKPYSDSAISEMLEKEGVQVARRTVAKYRECLNIPPSSQRKTL